MPAAHVSRRPAQSLSAAIPAATAPKTPPISKGREAAAAAAADRRAS